MCNVYAEKYVQEQFLGGEYMGEMLVQEDFLGEESAPNVCARRVPG